MQSIKETKLSEFLIEAKALIADPKSWTQNFYAKDERGNFVSPNDNKAVCFCSIGAMSKVRGPQFASWENGREVLKCEGELLLSDVMGCYIARFNDSSTHEEVMEAWDRAISKALVNEVEV